MFNYPVRNSSLTSWVFQNRLHTSALPCKSFFCLILHPQKIRDAKTSIFAAMRFMHKRLVFKFCRWLNPAGGKRCISHCFPSCPFVTSSAVGECFPAQPAPERHVVSLHYFFPSFISCTGGRNRTGLPADGGSERRTTSLLHPHIRTHRAREQRGGPVLVKQTFHLWLGWIGQGISSLMRRARPNRFPHRHAGVAWQKGSVVLHQLTREKRRHTAPSAPAGAPNYGQTHRLP